MIDFKALPKFSGASRVIEIIVANIAEVDSKLEPTASADEAVLLIAIASSSVSEAVVAANAEYTSVTVCASLISILKPRTKYIPFRSLI